MMVVARKRGRGRLRRDGSGGRGGGGGGGRGRRRVGDGVVVADVAEAGQRGAETDAGARGSLDGLLELEEEKGRGKSRGGGQDMREDRGTRSESK